MWHLLLGLVSWWCCSGVICTAVSVLEGESVTIDCGFQTTIHGGNLLWQVSSNSSEIPLGHIVPGDHFCGIEYIECTVHTNGSITLFDVTLSYGEKYYRCLRGDKEGYHYFSHVDLTVVSKESLGHPVIQPLTESKANVYKIGEKGVIHGFDQPTCEDKEDGALVVTCYPPSGLIVDKVYDQVHCNCTDSDGNTNSLNITVNKSLGHPVIQPLTESKANVYKIGEKDVIHGFDQPTCEDKEDGALVVTCYPPSGLIVDKVYDQVHCNCTDSDGNTNSLNITVNSHANMKKNNAAIITLSAIIGIIVVFGVIWCICRWCKIKNARNSENASWRTRLGSGMPKEINDLQEMNQRKDAIIFYLIHKLTEINDSLYLRHNMSHLDIPCSSYPTYSNQRHPCFCEVCVSRNCKKSDLNELLSSFSKHCGDHPLFCKACKDHHMKYGENLESLI